MGQFTFELTLELSSQGELLCSAGFRRPHVRHASFVVKKLLKQILFLENVFVTQQEWFFVSLSVQSRSDLYIRICSKIFLALGQNGLCQTGYRSSDILKWRASAYMRLWFHSNQLVQFNLKNCLGKCNMAIWHLNVIFYI